MNKYIVIASTFLLFACNNTEQPVEVVDEVNVEITKHGEDITEDGAITPAEFFTQIKDKDSLVTKLATTINEVCQKKGCWMMLDLGNGTAMRVSFKDYGFFVPKDAAGKLAIVQGVAKMDTTDIATLKHYAEDAKAPQEEIDAITEPEINYSFEAVGVIIKGESTTPNEE